MLMSVLRKFSQTYSVLADIKQAEYDVDMIFLIEFR